jgi:hypothetical protein
VSYQKNIVAANAVWNISGAGSFIRLLATTAAVRVETYLNGSITSQVDNVQGGFWRKGDIDQVRITDLSGAVNTVEIIIDDGEVGYDRSVGTVAISGSVGVYGSSYNFAQSQQTVTNAAAQLLGANTGRRYLMIQNKDAAGKLYINFGGTATVANGLYIPPGGMWEWNTVQSNQAISAIGDIASNANIIVITT